ncbi:hypothetical protein [Streptomyces sp. NPDC058955]|uniref:hypothetical protein n=1 Tax=unclassified Streptomyces TaxID=2593676 RepID=UPI0036559363
MTTLPARSSLPTPSPDPFEIQQHEATRRPGKNADRTTQLPFTPASAISGFGTGLALGGRPSLIAERLTSDRTVSVTVVNNDLKIRRPPLI